MSASPSPLEEQRAANDALWSRFNDLQVELRRDCLALIRTEVLDRYPTAVTLSAEEDGDRDGSWIRLCDITLADDTEVELHEDEATETWCDDVLTPLLSNLFTWWIETDRYGAGEIDLRAHPFSPDEAGLSCTACNLPDENERHRV